MTEESIMSQVNQGYDNIWKAFIKPEKMNYDLGQLGPAASLSTQGVSYQRDDFLVTNAFLKKLHCSVFLPEGYTADEPAKPGMPAVSSEPCCVVYLHSQSGCRIEGLPLVDECMNRKYGLCVFDYSSCGMSEGEYVSLGYYEKNDLHIILNELRGHYLFKRFILWGRSMGAVTAILYAEKNPPSREKHFHVSGLILDSPFTDINTLAKDVAGSNSKIPKVFVQMGMGVVKSTIKKKLGFEIESLRPVDSIKQVQTPILFHLCTKDILVKPKRVRKYYEDYRGNDFKRLVESPIDHNSERPASFYQDGLDFSSECLGKGKGLRRINDSEAVSALKKAMNKVLYGNEDGPGLLGDTTQIKKKAMPTFKEVGESPAPQYHPHTTNLSDIGGQYSSNKNLGTSKSNKTIGNMNSYYVGLKDEPDHSQNKGLNNSYSMSGGSVNYTSNKPASSGLNSSRRKGSMNSLKIFESDSYADSNVMQKPQPVHTISEMNQGPTTASQFQSLQKIQSPQKLQVESKFSGFQVSPQALHQASSPAPSPQNPSIQLGTTLAPQTNPAPFSPFQIQDPKPTRIQSLLASPQTFPSQQPQQPIAQQQSMSHQPQPIQQPIQQSMAHQPSLSSPLPHPSNPPPSLPLQPLHPSPRKPSIFDSDTMPSPQDTPQNQPNNTHHQRNLSGNQLGGDSNPQNVSSQRIIFNPALHQAVQNHRNLDLLTANPQNHSASNQPETFGQTRIEAIKKETKRKLSENDLLQGTAPQPQKYQSLFAHYPRSAQTVQSQQPVSAKTGKPIMGIGMKTEPNTQQNRSRRMLEIFDQGRNSQDFNRMEENNPFGARNQNGFLVQNYDSNQEVNDDNQNAINSIPTSQKPNLKPYPQGQVQQAASKNRKIFDSVCSL